MLRTILAILGIILAAAILYYIFFYHGGLFNSNQASTAPLNIDLQAIKPETWQPYDDGLKEISIDGDSDPEWLFLYVDTGSTNQIGGVIYDAQNRPKDINAMAVSQQAPAYLIPYRLMPDYVANKSVGYLADEKVDFNTVTIDQKKNQEDESKSDTMSGDLLQISGSRKDQPPNRFSVFWWIDPQQGYGGAMAYTPGWFSLSSTNPHDWPNWAGGENETRGNITEFFSWEPQMDRSNICRLAKWDLTGDINQNTVQLVSDYPNSSLAFCSGKIPGAPAFPEAQVLAFLLDKSPDRWQNSSTAMTFTKVSVHQISEPVIDKTTTQVEVFVDFAANDGEHSMVWDVVMVPPSNLNQSVQWRIVSARNR